MFILQQNLKKKKKKKKETALELFIGGPALLNFLN